MNSPAQPSRSPVRGGVLGSRQWPFRASSPLHLNQAARVAYGLSKRRVIRDGG
jgi:hypothetical protein